MTQSEQAELFRRLHQGPEPLIVGNAWDAASARVFEVAGFGAIGTSSAAIAYTLGYPDGQRISRREMLDAVARIARAVTAPVTADVEAGYGTTTEAAAETARKVIEAGAVGLNLEDLDNGELIPLSVQIDRIQVMRRVGDDLGIRLVINARTDIFLAGIGPPETRVPRALERLRAYRDAGADCLFAPGVTDPQTIAILVGDLRHPLNILAVAGSPSIAELHRLGVARVSVGSGPMRATLGLVQRIATELLTKGTYSAMVEGAVSYPDVNRMMGAAKG